MAAVAAMKTMKRLISTRWGDILTPPINGGKLYYPQPVRPMQEFFSDTNGLSGTYFSDHETGGAIQRL